jgi:hypothetical protein
MAMANTFDTLCRKSFTNTDGEESWPRCELVSQALLFEVRNLPYPRQHHHQLNHQPGHRSKAVVVSIQ